MKEIIEEWFSNLAAQGQKLLSDFPKTDGNPSYWTPDAAIPTYQQWLSSVVNLLRTIALPGSHFINEYERLLEHKRLNAGLAQLVPNT